MQFDLLQIQKFGIYYFVKGSVILEYGKILIDEQTNEYLKISFSPDEDSDVLAEILRWTTFYDSLKFVPCDDDTLLGQDLAKECAESQSGTDTGTVVE